jgi:hypothetical protein
MCFCVELLLITTIQRGLLKTRLKKSFVRLVASRRLKPINHVLIERERERKREREREREREILQDYKPC